MWGEGGGRQSLKYTDGDVPMCMRNKDKDVGMKSKEIEKSRGEGGGRHRYRHVEGDVPLCTRGKVEENEATSKENEKSSSSRGKCDGGSKNMTKKLKVKAKAQTAAGPKQTR